jgi:hypothetical protein
MSKSIGLVAALAASLGWAPSSNYTNIRPKASVNRTGRTYYSGWHPSTLGRKGVRGKSAPNNRRTTKLARASRKRNRRRA